MFRDTLQRVDKDIGVQWEGVYLVVCVVAGSEDH